MNPTPRMLETSHGPLTLGPRCLIMGILNVTPDSFSDGGRFFQAAAAVDHGRQMVADGADLIDVGGESTRPGSHGVDADEQISRVVPVIRCLRSAGVRVPISIDTRSAIVAAAALDAGADIVNDVSGIRHDPQMIELLRGSCVPFIVMHMQGTPETMQDRPHYDDVVAEVTAFFNERAATLTEAGVPCDRMIIDPGIGFGKTLEHNLSLLREIGRFAGNRPLLVGPSRKRFIRQLLKLDAVSEVECSQSEVAAPRPVAANPLLAGSVAVAIHCALAGVDILRVHDVREVRLISDALAR